MSFPCQGPYFTKSIKDDSGDELTIKIIGYIDKIVVLAFVNDIIDCTVSFSHSISKLIAILTFSSYHLSSSEFHQ